MNIETAKLNIGKQVMTCDAGAKMIYRIYRHEKAHGPYLLERVTKGGLLILSGYEYQVPPRLAATYADYLRWNEARS